MVVVDNGIMLTGNNQYLQPDYLSPLPTTLDSKKSPLALLAQTCSQIGADPVIKINDKKKNDEKTDKSSPAVTSASSDVKLGFKPYDLGPRKEDPPPKKDDKSGFKTPTSKPESPATRTSKSPEVSTSKSSPDSSKTTESTATSSGTMPIIRPGLEVLQGHPRDLPLGTFKPLPGLHGYPPAALPPLYPPTSSVLSPYMGYARVKTATGGETLVPVCRDPYCTGCQYSAHNIQMLNGQCPAGCSQCEQAKKLGLPPALPMLGATANPFAAAYSPHGLLGSQMPYVCNWIVGETYCGKRFTTSEELLQHLRTHTNLSASDSFLGSHGLLSPSLHRAFPPPSLSPLSAARYHPYSKPPGLPTALSVLPPGPLPPLAPHAGSPLAPYYPSPYSLYGQRLGAVHP